MLYCVYPRTGSAKLYMEPRSRNRVPYHTAKEMRKLYPNNNFAVIGEIGGFARSPNNGDRLLTEDGKVLLICPRGSLKRPFEWVTGYIAVGESTYLAAIRGVIPAFSRPSTGRRPEDKEGSTCEKGH